MQTKDRAVVLLSGGPDSSSLAYWANNEGYELLGLHLYQGRKYSDHELHSAKEVTKDLGISLETIDISQMVTLFGKVPTIHSEASYLQYGTAIVTSIATAYALQCGAEKCFIAIHADDKAEGPEFSMDFFKAMENSIHVAQKHRPYKNLFEILVPFLNKDKYEVLKIGKDLGVSFENTWSCIAATEGVHCGLCGACHSRQDAFKKAGIEDPTVYQRSSL